MPFHNLGGGEDGVEWGGAPYLSDFRTLYLSVFVRSFSLSLSLSTLARSPPFLPPFIFLPFRNSPLTPATASHYCRSTLCGDNSELPLSCFFFLFLSSKQRLCLERDTIMEVGGLSLLVSICRNAVEASCKASLDQNEIQD